MSLEHRICVKIDVKDAAKKHQASISCSVFDEMLALIDAVLVYVMMSTMIHHNVSTLNLFPIA